MQLHFDIFDTTSGNVIEVAGSGQDLVDYIRERARSHGSKEFRNLADTVTPKSQVALGNVDEKGRVHEEWFELDLGHDWLKKQIPESVRIQAWGRRLSSNPSTDEANARWLIAKYGLTRAEAKKVISTGDVNGVVRAHETWMKEHGYPPHNSPAARERLLYLAQFSTDWRKGLDWPDFASNPRLVEGDTVSHREHKDYGTGQVIDVQPEWVFVNWPSSDLRTTGGQRVTGGWYEPKDLIKQRLASNPDKRIPKHAWSFEEQIWNKAYETALAHGESRSDAREYADGQVRADRDERANAGDSFSDEYANNPSDGGAGTLLGVLIGAGLIGVVWLAMRSERAEASPAPALPPPAPGGGQAPVPLTKKCTSDDALNKFGAAKGYKIWYVEQVPVAQWQPPKPQYLTDPSARAYSVSDCGFYKWTGLAWVPDTALDSELAAWASATTEATPLSPAPSTPLSPTPTPTSNASPVAPATPQPSGSQAVQWLPPAVPTNPVTTCSTAAQCPPYHDCVMGVCVPKTNVPVWGKGE